MRSTPYSGHASRKSDAVFRTDMGETGVTAAIPTRLPCECRSIMPRLRWANGAMFKTITWNFVDCAIHICNAIEQGLPAGSSVRSAANHNCWYAGCKDCNELEETVAQHNLLRLEDGELEEVAWDSHDRPEPARPSATGHKRNEAQPDACTPLQCAN